MAEQSEARIYGMADQANRDPPPAQGMRGDKASVRAGEGDPALSHQLALGDGNTVTISEGSGVAYAEATGRAGLAGPKLWLEPVSAEDDEPARVSLWPIAAGLLVSAGILAFAAWRMRESRAAANDDPLANFPF
ncbi:hypothetical protein ACFSCW_12120 [Sphingomonas tabacisoli]|uniref:Uncharacterized protein n=1 Tax=Sphingomonas tabacisoli TaxID=2249466 RepID=A0ABW4I5M2_9SPHN